MREMKDSGAEWIGVIPSEWDFLRGKAIFRQRTTKGNTEEVLLSATQQFGMYPQSLIEGVVQVKEETDLQTFKTVHKNDYVISLRSFQGGFEMSDYEGICSPAYQVLHNIKPIDYRYYKMLFKSDGFISKMNSLTVGIREGKNIQFADFAKTQIPYPSIEEQKRIADYLNSKCAKIDSIIEKQQAIIEKLKEYKLSVITEAVTKGLNLDVEMKNSGIDWIGYVPKQWSISKLKYLFGTGDDGLKIGPFGSAMKGKTLESGPYKIYNQAHLIQNDFSLNRHFVSEETFKELLSYEVKPDDILFSMMGTIGKCQIMPSGYPKGIMDSHLLKARLNDKILPQFFVYAYDKDYSNQVIQQLLYVSNGTIMNGLNSSILKNVVIALPPVEEQIEIVSYLDRFIGEVDSRVQKVTTIVEKLQEYKKSLIYEVVTGKKEV